MKPLIYLDMDGVCCDFVKASLEVIGRKDLINNWPKGIVYIEDYLEMSHEQFWKKIDKIGYPFWSSLEETPWFKELYSELNKLGDVYFCTSPTRNPDCVKGKLMWLQDRFGERINNYIFIKDKFLLARKNDFLIDDFDSQCNDFVKHGGNAILFPQPWNTNNHIENKVSFVLTSIKNRL